MSKFNYCSKCGNNLSHQVIRDKTRAICLNCGYIHWNTESISVGGIVLRDQQSLLVQRNENPGKGL